MSEAVVISQNPPCSNSDSCGVTWCLCVWPFSQATTFGNREMSCSDRWTVQGRLAAARRTRVLVKVGQWVMAEQDHKAIFHVPVR